MKRAIPLWGAWEAGQWAGGHINQGINWGLSKLKGSDTSLGGMIYDMTHGGPQKLNGEIRVRVDQDGQISSVSTKSSNPHIPLDVYGGRTMINPL